MRLQVLSDLHFEFDADGGEAFARSLPVSGEVLILAGDVVPLHSLAVAQSVFGWFCGRFEHVIFVPGNHEYYRTVPAEGNALLRTCAKALPNLHPLDAGSVEIAGLRFLGCTLWFPHSPDESLYRRFVADFSMIERFVPWVHETHAAHMAFLEQELRTGDIVITHHLPHPRSVDPQYAASPLNRFFLAEGAAKLVERGSARLWIHGHTHTPCDYSVGPTRVICNPRGYPGEAKPRVNLELVVDLG